MISERVDVRQQVGRHFKLGLVHEVNAYFESFVVEIGVDAVHFFLVVIFGLG
jgi:hypothetical protein